MPELFEFCIYAIVHGDKLKRAFEGRKRVQFTETKTWSTGKTLLEKAMKEESAMAIIFCDAKNCTELLYWGQLKKIKIKADNKTSYTVDLLREVKGKQSPQKLILRKTGKKIAPKYIRSYAICRTPKFITD